MVCYMKVLSLFGGCLRYITLKGPLKWWAYTRWAPTSDKWSCNSYKLGYNRSYPVLRPFTGLTTPFTSGMGPALFAGTWTLQHPAVWVGILFSRLFIGRIAKVVLIFFDVWLTRQKLPLTKNMRFFEILFDFFWGGGRNDKKDTPPIG